MQHPYHHHRHVPLPPKPGLSPLIIVLIVLGAVLVVGIGSCALIGGLVMLGASAEADGQPGQPATPPMTATPPATAAAPATPATSPTAAPTSLDDPNDDPASAANEPGAPAPTSTNSGGPTWFCTASASVRVCGFAGACNYQMVFGNGFNRDRFLAQQQAKNACENSARIKGASTVCAVSCSMR